MNHYHYQQKRKAKRPWWVLFVLILIITGCAWVYMLDWAGVIDVRYVDDNGSAITDPNN